MVLAATTTGAAAAVSPTVRMSIVHHVRGCHVWSAKRLLGASTKITVKRGTKLQVRISCPMDFDFAQLSGPKLALGNPRSVAGTTRTIVLGKLGTYRLRATNVQTSEEQGLQTLGPDNLLTLTVVVR